MLRWRVFVGLVLVFGLLVSVVGQADDSVMLQEGGDVPLGSGLFDDVPVGHWADEAVGWAVSNGVMEGVSGGRFDLEGVVPRWQIVSVLYRAGLLAGGEVFGGGLGSGVFVDVPVGHVADGEVGWAVESGITEGVGGGRFDPDGSVTRAQIVTFLSRLNGLLGGPGGGGLGSGVFVDVPEGHWADVAVGWAVAGGVTRGVGDNRFDLDRVVSRAQIVTFLFRVVRLVEESRVDVTVEAVDLAHVDPGEVTVGLGLEDPVGVGEELKGAAGATGLAVVTDEVGNPQGLGLVVKNEGPVDLRVDYLTTAVALVFLRPGIATSNPLLTLGGLWVMKDLPEIRVLADQLEADARRLGNVYLTNMSEESSLALVDAIGALRAAFAGSNSETGAPVPSGPSFGGSDLVLSVWLDGHHRGVPVNPGGYRGKYSVISDGCNQLDCIKLAEDLDRRPVCTDEPVWREATVGSFGVWDPVDRGGAYGAVYGGSDPDGEPYRHKDGFCLGFSSAEGQVVGENLSWTGLAVPVEQNATGSVSFDDSYYFLTGGLLRLPGLGDVAEALVDTANTLRCKVLEYLVNLASISKDCDDANPWAELVDVIKGDELKLPINLFEQAGTVRFAVVRHASAGPNPYAEEFEISSDLTRLAGIYQLIHVLMPVINVVVDVAGPKLLDTLKNKYDFLESGFRRIEDLAEYNLHHGFDFKFAQYLSEVVHWMIRYAVASGREHIRGIVTDESTDLVLDLSGGALEDLAEYQQKEEAKEVDVAQLIGDAIWGIVVDVIENAMQDAIEGDDSGKGSFKKVNTFISVANAIGTLMYTGSLWGYQSLGFYSYTPPEETALQETSPVPVTVRMGINGCCADTSFWQIPIEKGWFDEMGIKVELKDSRSSADNIASLRGGDLHVATVWVPSLFKYLETFSQSLPTIFFGDVFSGYMILVAPYSEAKTALEFMNEGMSFSDAAKEAVEQLIGEDIYIPPHSTVQVQHANAFFAYLDEWQPNYEDWRYHANPQYVDDPIIIALSAVGRVEFAMPSGSPSMAALIRNGWEPLISFGMMQEHDPSSPQTAIANANLGGVGLLANRLWAEQNRDTVYRILSVGFRTLAYLEDPNTQEDGWAFQASTINSHQHVSLDAVDVGIFWEMIHPSFTWEDQEALWDTSLPSYHPETAFAGQIENLKAEDVLSSGFDTEAELAKLLLAQDLYYEMREMRIRSGQLFAQAAGMELTDEQTALVQQARAFYARYNFLDALRTLQNALP